MNMRRETFQKVSRHFLSSLLSVCAEYRKRIEFFAYAQKHIKIALPNIAAEINGVWKSSNGHRSTINQFSSLSSNVLSKYVQNLSLPIEILKHDFSDVCLETCES